MKIKIETKIKKVFLRLKPKIFLFFFSKNKCSLNSMNRKNQLLK